MKCLPSRGNEVLVTLAKHVLEHCGQGSEPWETCKGLHSHRVDGDEVGGGETAGWP